MINKFLSTQIVVMLLLNRSIARATCIFIFSWALINPGSLFAQGEIPFESLFNGTDITGWSLQSASDDLKDFVTVEDGAVTIK